MSAQTLGRCVVVGILAGALVSSAAIVAYGATLAADDSGAAAADAITKGRSGAAPPRSQSASAAPRRSHPAARAPAWHPLKEMFHADPPAGKPGVAGQGSGRVAGEVLVKLKKNARATLTVPQGAAPGKGNVKPQGQARGLDALLAKHGVTSAEPAFRVAKDPAARAGKNTALQRIAAAQAAAHGKDRQSLFRWHRLRLPPNADIDAAITDLRADPEVEFAEPNYEYRLADIDPPIEGLPDATTDPGMAYQWHHAVCSVQAGWNHLKQGGAPPGGMHDVVVAVIDTGVDYTHPELVGNMWTNPDEIPANNIDDDHNGFVDDIYGCSVVSDARSHAGDPKDLHGHGTHVAGIVAAQAFNQMGGVGVAFNVRIMSIRAADYSGTISVTDATEAILYAVDNGAEVINMSWGGYQYSQVIVDALEVALNQAVLAAAAGNDGLSGLEYPMYPAALYFVHGVMACTAPPQIKLTWFTNYHYDMLAPGEGIYSTIPGDRYAAWSGTSMATPVVSGIAALMRSYFWQRDIYSSRFLMGSLYASQFGPGSYGPVNAYRALTEPPTPGVSMLKDWIFDDSTINPQNDDDGRVDSGETIHVAIELINRSGQADQIVGTLRAHAEGAPLDDPYVTITTPTVSFGTMGPWATEDNGFVYDQGGVIIGVEHPFVFTVDPNCPNEHVIPFELTITFLDGWNPENPGPYTRVSRFEYVVQRGKNVPTIIASGSSVELTADDYWMVAGPVLVEPNATLTIRPGTQVQWGAISSDPYNPGPQSGYVIVRGTLLVQGTLQSPANLFPSYFVSGQKTKITVESGGHCDMEYVKIRNPELTGIHKVDHAYMEWDAFSSTVDATDLRNCIFHKFRGGGSIKGTVFDTVAFDAGWIAPSKAGWIRNSVFLQDNENNKALSLTLVPTASRACEIIRVQPYAGKTYAALAIPCALTAPYNSTTGAYFSLVYVRPYAEYFSGHVADVADAAENSFLVTMFCSSFNIPSCAGDERYGVLGMVDDPNNPGGLTWYTGAPVTFTDWGVGYPCASSGLGTIVAISHRTNHPWITFEGCTVGDWAQKRLICMLELPGDVTEATLRAAIGSPDLITYVLDHIEAPFSKNGFLSKYWEPNVGRWMRIYAQANHPDGYCSARENYWGTATKALVDYAIIDYFDNFTSARVDYGTPPAHGFASTYPFVESVLINGVSAETVPVVGSGPTTFTITFNRDMDTSVQPFVTFGPAPPHTDFTVKPIGDGWVNARTWEGTFWIVPVTGEGYHCMRISGAVAADDPWLVSGYDVGRFRFEIQTMGVAAMTLQAVGQEGSILLTWQQNDYDLIAGYNLYRADTAGGPYTRINTYTIPIGSESYVDTNVVPAVPKYYKFTVVLTDLTESDFSNVASAAALDTIPPVITHAPVTSAPPSLGLRLTATVTDNVRVEGVTIHYRPQGGSTYTSLAMINTSGNSWTGTVPGSAVLPPGIEYHLSATDGISEVYSGTPAVPYVVAVSNTPTLTSVSPNHGPVEGGTPATLSGTLFQPNASVFFGGVLATNIVVMTANQITCTTPPHYPAMVDVKVVNPDATECTLLNGFRYEQEGVVVSLPSVAGDRGTMVDVSLSAANVVGLRAADVTITFTSSVVAARSVATGTLTSGWSLSANTGEPGTIQISLASATAVTGSGTLARITFEVIGSPPASTALTISSAALNDGAMSCTTSNGTFTVSGYYSVSGTVNYFTTGPVPGTTLKLTGSGSFSTVSGTDGTFTIADIPTGAYTLTPSKADDVGAITAYDASLILQKAAGTLSLTANQMTAADVNRNGSVSSMDASYVLEKSVELLEVPFPGAGVVWRFVPAERSYSLLNADQTGQNFTAVLLGDVSGNWQPGGGGLLGVGAAASPSATLTLGTAQGHVGRQVALPVRVELDEAAVYSVDLTITYDPSLLSPDEVSRGDAAVSMMLAANIGTPGTIRAALAGADPISQTGTVLEVLFTITGPSAAPTPVSFVTAELNEGAIMATLQNGAIVVVAGPPADFDADGDVDLADFGTFQRCFNGPNRPYGATGCEGADFDTDNDVDLSDFGAFQLCFNGPNRPPACE